MDVRRPAVAVLLIVLMASLAASCDEAGGQKRVICDYALDSGTFAGRVVARAGSAVTYRVDDVQTNPDARAAGLPQPRPGTLVVVHYESGEQQFLHIGSRYSVKVWPLHGFFSSVHTANHPCSGGTVHADGTAIDTSLARQSHVLQLLVALASFVAAAVLIAIAWATKKRRRQAQAVMDLGSR